MDGNLTENGGNDDARDCRVGGRHGGASVVVGGAFDLGWYHTMFRSQ